MYISQAISGMRQFPEMPVKFFVRFCSQFHRCWFYFQVELWRSLDDEERKSYLKKSSKCPDPVPSLFRPDSNFGSVTETIDEMIENYVDRESRKIVLPIKGAKPFDPEEFRVRLVLVNNLLSLKSIKLADSSGKICRKRILHSTHKLRYISLACDASEVPNVHRRPRRTRGCPCSPVRRRAFYSDDPEHLPFRRQRWNERHPWYPQVEGNPDGEFKFLIDLKYGPRGLKRVSEMIHLKHEDPKYTN